MELKINTPLKGGKYRIIKTIGKGGFGITYLANSREQMSGPLGHFDVDVSIAIKEFFVKDDCTRANDGLTVVCANREITKRVERYKEKFIKEAHSIAELQHPNIIHVSDVFEENGTVYYAMKYLNGGSLRDIIKTSGNPMSEDRALKYIRQIAVALDYMHQRNICHLDVKPANIMLDEDDNAVLIDFGISKKYDEQGEAVTTTPVGVSQGYAPIEQYQASMKDFSPETDVYGLGATLLFLLTGNVPPDANTVLDRGLGDKPENITDFIWKVIKAAMRPIRKDRIKTMQSFLNILDGKEKLPEERQVANGIGFSTDDNDEVTVTIMNNDDGQINKPTAETQSKPKASGSNKTLVFIASMLCAFALVTGIGWLLNHRDKVEQVEDRRIGDCTYTGELLNGSPHGHGIARYSDGRFYEGNFDNGLRSDTAAHFIYSNKYEFNGTFAADTIKEGKVVTPEGDYFIGTFSSNGPYNGLWYDGSNGKPYVRIENGKEASL